MSDFCLPAKRSKIMASIRGKDTKGELLVRRYLFRKGFRFRVNDKRLIGKPDIVLAKYRTVVFVNGCFWHGHELCPDFVRPKTNTAFWDTKIETNRKRDERVIKALTEQGWHVIVVWECELKGKEKREATLLGLANEIWDVL
ncbi:DNA mismatch endonuclease Vsr [Sphaerochaeta pleomorpha str. Grapes]|uniref:Very short patch repair endonuclease n=1 Tax=Sphaerochaeta pleomorpha (strain ATCC BAA-1885 / DSM 22778 / Grapes) TaxID=158190 RepID=G8QVZ1_SPHPG|nr:very short patch repair endonuclease [Sphaerochaeta pleomorpha]AEV30515.1 DNA mismatch endonuclease Vsr [Sphaerochaeta pleomorpha str. Grapes]